MHLHTKLKKIQTEEERLAEIEKDNRLLLEKMSGIMRTRGRIDNVNSYDHKSLNKIKRQRDMLRVTSENQQILKRISAKEPHYKHQAWDDDWRKNQQFMENITRFPKDVLAQQVAKGKRTNKKDPSASDESPSKSDDDSHDDDKSKVTEQADSSNAADQDASKAAQDEEINEAITEDQNATQDQQEKSLEKPKTPEVSAEAEEATPVISTESDANATITANATESSDKSQEKKASTPTTEEFRPKSSASAKSVKSASSAKSIKSASSVKSAKSAASRSSRSRQIKA
ncbi:uncharacterized protein TRIADDRAFT_60218 [Trichoplax adhaerens]|uniref:Cilia- and flagella-associated protein 97 n=1 Tax=Trichoplax adhaerens TaxID=10228 RepID=B3S7M4_TRIAD|nr:hypothetical protein TRIADDRAFT_60218 [Trichoplax adhaerens]EDV21223.1 hypothetical protein TRIADDRAFT_60218 [Trichoplax adhaerens]|eukprot:XP_002116190.1 hypothetical protein TRIADDRAFT_60218 [Trichoplax adhaerens]